jgi:L-lactate dehydrogenase
MAKVVLIGLGNVGMSFAFSLVNSNSKVSELALIDRSEQKARGEAADLNHAAAYNSNRILIKSGAYQDCDDADIVVVCAGAPQLPGETRRDLVAKNTKVFKNIISEINKTKFDGIYLIATNPLDAMTQLTQKLSGFAHHKVMGTGTTLDTARLRFLIGQDLKIHPGSVHVYVVGEHGDSSFVTWSSGKLGLDTLDNKYTKEQKEQLASNVRQSAYDIINDKGATYYGIGVMLRDLVDCIINDSYSIRTVSRYCPPHDVYVALPTVIAREGVVRSIDFELNKEESKSLQISIEAIKETLKETGEY